MKRLLGILVGAGLALSIGCAGSYDYRLEDSLKNLVYRRNLDKNTEAPPSKSNLEKEKVYIRAPKGMKQLAATFAYNVEQGKFDITDTILDPDKQVSLHILARNNAPKAAATPKKGPNPSGEADTPPPANRGDFTTDVLDVIKSAYSTDLESSQLKGYDPPAQGTRKSVPYRSASKELGDKEVKVYFFGDKNQPAQVALIFEGPKDAIRGMITKIDYSLNSLAVGARANSLYNGQDDLAGDEAAASGPAVF
jgi:hypothetical protein